MKILALSLCVLGGCTDQAADDYPVAIGDQNVPTQNGASDATMLRGRVCMSDSMIDLGNCSDTGAGGLQVAVGGNTATTHPDGSFAIDRPTGSLLQFTVSGNGVVPTTTPFSAASTIPVISADVYARTLTSNGIELPDGVGLIRGSVVRDGNPLTGVTVSSAPIASFDPFFDADPEGYSIDGTGSRGVFFVPGVTSGSANLTLNDSVGGSTLVNGISVINGGVTILDSVPLP
ncbi:MAG: hypothetical protein WKG01_21540 [Kofleriaceae bacterium]